MIKENFNNLTKKHFSFLVATYGFKITEETRVGENPLYFGRIVYVTSPRKISAAQRSTGVQITLDRGYILIDIGPLDLDRKEWVDISDIMRMVDPKLVVYDRPDYAKEAQVIIESQLIKLSDLVQRYCSHFLKGDFSLYNSIIEARANWREQTLKELNQKYKKA